VLPASSGPRFGQQRAVGPPLLAAPPPPTVVLGDTARRKEGDPQVWTEKRDPSSMARRCEKDPWRRYRSWKDVAERWWLGNSGGSAGSRS
jgi:hypothetical protein